jgi:predicted PurR-regulated permease PerM
MALERPRGQGRRWAAVLTVVLAAAAAVVAVAFLVAPIAAREASHFADDAPKLVQRIGDLPLVGDRLVDAKVPEHIQQWVQQLPGQLGTEDAPLVNAFRSALSGLTAAIATVAMVLAVLLDGRRLRSGVMTLGGASTFGWAVLHEFHCSGFRNMTEQSEQA